MNKKAKIIFLIFAAALIIFICWNMGRAGMLNRQHEDIIARADYLIARSEKSIERWNHGNKW